MRAAAEAWGDRTAIEDGDVVLSYAQVHAQARRAGAGLMARGIERGDRVAIWAPNIWEWIVAALGVHYAGAILVPINTRYKGAEAAFILRRAGAKLLFAVQGFLGTDYLGMLRQNEAELPPEMTRVVLRGDAPEGAIAFDAFLLLGADEDIDARMNQVGADDLSDILFTSGTTGEPKGAMTTHAQTLKVYGDWANLVGLGAEDRYLVVAPFFHCFGYKAGWLAAFLKGATVLPQAVFDAAAVLERVEPDRVSVLPGPPALYQTLLGRSDLGDYDLSSLRLAVTGAAVIPVELIHRMRDTLGFQTVITGYGLTEATGVATMCRHDDDPETIATTSGRAIPDVEVQVVNPEGIEVPRGEPGEVVVRGYNVMKGYWGDETATGDAVDAQGWLHTGDIGVMDVRGYLRITDRLKDMFIMGGFNCYPAEIERLMLRNERLAHAAVIGVPDERMGEVGMAFVVPAQGAEVGPESVTAWCRAHIANFKVPRHVVVVDALPTNAVGKVTKFILRERAARLLAAE
jgi:acyl-CoA synthetase (AMP-forming)/AMP-acid ligase II